MTIIRLSEEGYIINSMLYRDGDDKEHVQWLIKCIEGYIASKQKVKIGTALYIGKDTKETIVVHWKIKKV